MSRRDPELERLDAALRDRVEDLAIELLGTPNKRLTTRREMRWGKRGSVKLNLDGRDRGLYVNYEDGNTGGGPLDMIMIEMGMSGIADAIDWAYGWLGWEKPRLSSMTVAERLEIEADIRRLNGEDNSPATGTSATTISGAAIAARNGAASAPAQASVPSRGRFSALLADVAVPDSSEQGEAAEPVGAPEEQAPTEAPFEPAPFFVKGEYSREADIGRLTVLVMGGDTVFQYEGYADGEFSDMMSEAMDRAVGSIAREIVADVTARHGKAGA